MKTYVVEVLNYTGKEEEIQLLIDQLKNINGLYVIDTFVENGDPITEGAGAGVIVQYDDDENKTITKMIRSIQSKLYGYEEIYYRIGACQISADDYNEAAPILNVDKLDTDYFKNHPELK